MAVKKFPIEAGAIALAEPGRLDGVTAPLTAGEALSGKSSVARNHSGRAPRTARSLAFT